MNRKQFRKIRPRLNSLLSRFLPKAMVLIYHRVSELGVDPQRLSVTPANFEKHMELVSRYYYPISLIELVDNLRSGIVRDKTIVVTFDDGYEDNYINARPILEKYGVPATIFVATGYTGVKREFWWDELERLILRQLGQIDEISLELDGKTVYWGCKDKDRSVGKIYSAREIYIDLCARFQQLKVEQIDYAIEKLRLVTGDKGKPRPDYIAMSVEQLCSLHNGGLIEIGAHTRSHVNLAAQTQERQREEIEGSKVDLERMLGAEVKSFSYPFGTFNDYTPQTVQCVKDAGFSNSIANYSGNVIRLTNTYEIPRRMVRNWQVEVFKNALEQYYSGKRRITVPGS